MLKQTTYRFRQQRLPGGPVVAETPRISSWHATKANLGARWAT